MNNNIFRKTFIASLLSGCIYTTTYAQVYTSSSNLTAQPQTDRIVPFKLSEKGIVRDVKWGGDLAWFDENNLRRCALFMGKDNVDVVRTSFQPTYALIDGKLQEPQIEAIQRRVTYIKRWTNPDVEILLNCDDPQMDPYFSDSINGANAKHWVELMDVSMKQYQDSGLNVVAVAPFNEPDNLYSHQGTQNTKKRQQELYEISVETRNNPRFDNIRICGANTLNTDVALEWYNVVKDYVEEANTHQLAGSFDNYAEFYTTVRNDGKIATNDEMHNVMEAMVGLEYGLQTGIWWGTADLARGEFCKASHGERIAYAEHRDNWTAASVYRAPDGKIQAFGGTSERQAVETTYRFISEERDVFFDGQGPQREYTMLLPGGEGYQNGQTGAERVINITWGEDIQPYVDGNYVIYNKGMESVVEIEGGSLAQGAKIKTGTYSFTKKYQQWKVNPVVPTIGGDYSYHSIISVANGLTWDLQNWSLEEGGGLITYSPAFGSNQQWYLDYAGDGWFYIRSRYSSLCMEAVNGNVEQHEKSNKDTQLWRFLPVISRHSITDIAAPTGVKAEAQNASVKLTWNSASALNSYVVLRSETSGGPYELIARDIKGGEFIDNKIKDGKKYYYTVKTVDRSLNTSPRSEEVSAAATCEKGMVASFDFDNDIADQTANVNTPASFAEPSFKDGMNETQAVFLDGKNNFLQLPTEVASHNNITVAGWIYWSGGSDNQRIFDFGCGDNNRSFYLTPRSDKYTIRAGIKNGDKEYIVESSYYDNILFGKWNHIAVTIGEDGMKLYINGELKDENTNTDIRTTDFMPFINYIGRGQDNTNPLFYGRIDDFKIYNYNLTGSEIKQIMNNEELSISSTSPEETGLQLNAFAQNNILKIDIAGTEKDKAVILNIYNMQGVNIINKEISGENTLTMDVSNIPDGLYMISASQGKNVVSKKIIINN